MFWRLAVHGQFKVNLTKNIKSVWNLCMHNNYLLNSLFYIRQPQPFKWHWRSEFPQMRLSFSSQWNRPYDNAVLWSTAPLKPILYLTDPLATTKCKLWLHKRLFCFSLDNSRVTIGLIAPDVMDYLTKLELPFSETAI